MLDIRVEFFPFVTEERTQATKDADVPLQLEDGVVKLAAFRLVGTIFLLQFETE